MMIETLLKRRALRVERALDLYLKPGGGCPAHLLKAMRYSLFAGGKRVRPFLVVESAVLCGMEERPAYPLACAVEMVHTYSLIHDDLPPMDDDDWRRGKPSCHKKFGEAAAILAGDGLLSLAFEVIAEAPGVSALRARRAAAILAGAIGPRGMVGGQAADMQWGKRSRDPACLDRLNRLKTGCLFRACLRAGAVWGGAAAPEERALDAYGGSAGSLFQLIDDIIDRDGFARLAGIAESYRRARLLRDAAKRALKPFGRSADTLREFADFLYGRKH